MPFQSSEPKSKSSALCHLNCQDCLFNAIRAKSAVFDAIQVKWAKVDAIRVEWALIDAILVSLLACLFECQIEKKGEMCKSANNNQQCSLLT
jgi:hypothetical protein